MGGLGYFADLGWALPHVQLLASLGWPHLGLLGQLGFASYVPSSSYLAQTCSFGAGGGMNKRAKVFKPCKAHIWKWNTFISTAFHWPKQGNGQPRFQRQGNIHHLFMRGRAKSHCKEHDFGKECNIWSSFVVNLLYVVTSASTKTGSDGMADNYLGF